MCLFSTVAQDLCKNAHMKDWNDLRFFLEVARTGSVSAAAQRLGVNHSTVSRRISSLEEEQGVRLFDRVQSGYLLTEAAEPIYQKALEIESHHHAVDRLLFAGDQRLSGTLTVTMPHDLANHCVIPHLERFTHQYPAVELKLVVSAGLRDLAAREADIAVRLTPAPPDFLVGKKVADLRHGIYCARHYHTGTGPTHVICWNGETELPAWAKQHFPDARIVLKVDDLASMYAAVKAGIGLARMPCYLPDTLADHNIRKLDLPLVPSTWGVWILHHADLRETARVRAGKEFLTDILRNQRAYFEGGKSL